MGFHVGFILGGSLLMFTDWTVLKNRLETEWERTCLDLVKSTMTTHA